MTLDGAKIYYETAGQGDAVLFAHAGFVDSRMWDAQFEYFARYYQVIRFDMRGYGKSDPTQEPVVRRKEIYSLMRHLSIQKAALVGCSMGGATVLDFALEHPDMAQALVLVSTVPGGFEMQGEPPPGLFEMIAALQQNDLQRASELQIQLWVDGMFRKPEQVDPRVRRRAAEMNRTAVANQTYLRADMQLLQPLDPPAANRLKEVQIPTMVIAGELDHPEILRAAAFMAQEIPSAKIRILSNGAHMLNMELPDAFNQAGFDFLQGE
ncbi:MAG: alpha/beta hydrolase [Anaerolineaceae bacterium]|nr:alpha/beta hydrolase [Anaerolineaceae bacterium]